MLKTDTSWQKTVDVVVIGYGAAGAAAAITARDSGSEVLILEKSRQDNLHSNSSMAGPWIMGTNNVQQMTRYLEALNSISGNTAWSDPEIIRGMAPLLAESAAWLQRLGGNVKFVTDRAEHELPGSESLELWNYAGMGFRMMHFLYGKVKDRGITVAYDAAARHLLTNLRGEVTGVHAWTRDGRRMDIGARRAVIMACGGFEFNEQMKLNYLKAYPAYFTGTEANTGDGVRMAMEVGADLWHMNCVAARFVLKLSGMPWAVTMELAGEKENGQPLPGGSEKNKNQPPPPGYIVVDRAGRRFTNEVYKSHCLYYELGLFDSQRLVHPRIPSYWIFDQRRMDAGRLPGNRGGATGAHQLYHWSHNNSAELEKGWIIFESTARKLARKLDIPGDVLERTIAAYNRYCERGRDPECGRHPSTLVPLDKPPFYACRLWPGGPNTLGGPRRNVRCQVLNTDGDPIPRLYSAGELGSIFGMLYPVGGGNLSECIASGRTAAENAAREEPLAGMG